MPDIRMENVGDNRYILWINGKKQSGTHSFQSCMSMIAAQEEYEHKERARE